MRDIHGRKAPVPDHSRRISPEVAIPALLVVSDVAAILNVRTQYVYRLVAQHRIPHLKVGRLLRFYPGEIAAWIAQGHIEQTPPGRTV